MAKRSDKEIRKALELVGVEGSIFPVQQIGEEVQSLVVCSRLSYERTMLAMAKVIKKLWSDTPKRVEIEFGETTEYAFPEFIYEKK